jgi:hypothetical protein
MNTQRNVSGHVHRAVGLNPAIFTVEFYTTIDYIISLEEMFTNIASMNCINIVTVRLRLCGMILILRHNIE